MTWRDRAACRDAPDADATFFPVGERGTNLGNGKRTPDYRAGRRKVIEDEVNDVLHLAQDRAEGRAS